MAHVRQSWPDSGLGFQVIVLQPFQDVTMTPDTGTGVPRPS